jgi:outer membrane beta-barrel protein
VKAVVAAVALVALAGTSAVTAADVPTTQSPDQVVEPSLDRREVTIPRIDTEDFEIGVYGGLLSVEDFGSNSVFGGRLVYHVSEDFFVEGVYGQSTVTDEALCNLGLCLFPSREQDLKYYALSVGYNFFPGEVFLSKSRAMTSAVYVLGGVGNTSFLDEDRFTFNFGIGIRMLPVDWLALHVTVRDFIFESDILGTNKMTHNFELTAGLSVYF